MHLAIAPVLCMVAVPSMKSELLAMEGQEITLLTPASTLYQNLLGRRAGDFLEEFELLVIEVS